MLFGPIRLRKFGFLIYIEIDQSETRAGTFSIKGGLLIFLSWAQFLFQWKAVSLGCNCSFVCHFFLCSPVNIRLVAASLLTGGFETLGGFHVKRAPRGKRHLCFLSIVRTR